VTRGRRKGEDERSVENSAQTYCRLLNNRSLSLSVHFYIILPATLLEVATVIDRLIAPHPAHVLSTGRGGEALVLAMLAGEHALYKVGQRLEERGRIPLLQPGRTRASLQDSRLGHRLDARFAAHLNQVIRASARKALAVYPMLPPWLPQDTTTMAR